MRALFNTTIADSHESPQCILSLCMWLGCWHQGNSLCAIVNRTLSDGESWYDRNKTQWALFSSTVLVASGSSDQVVWNSVRKHPPKLEAYSLYAWKLSLTGRNYITNYTDLRNAVILLPNSTFRSDSNSFVFVSFWLWSNTSECMITFICFMKLLSGVRICRILGAFLSKLCWINLNVWLERKCRLIRFDSFPSECWRGNTVKWMEQSVSHCLSRDRHDHRATHESSVEQLAAPKNSSSTDGGALGFSSLSPHIVRIPFPTPRCDSVQRASYTKPRWDLKCRWSATCTRVR